MEVAIVCIHTRKRTRTHIHSHTHTHVRMQVGMYRSTYRQKLHVHTAFMRGQVHYSDVM